MIDWIKEWWVVIASTIFVMFVAYLSATNPGMRRTTVSDLYKITERLDRIEKLLQNR